MSETYETISEIVEPSPVLFKASKDDIENLVNLLKDFHRSQETNLRLQMQQYIIETLLISGKVSKGDLTDYLRSSAGVVEVYHQKYPDDFELQLQREWRQAVFEVANCCNTVNQIGNTTE